MGYPALYLHLQSLLDISKVLHFYFINNLKEILLKHSILSWKIADSVLLSLFMRDNGRCDIPHAA